ncbi:hypothetical protein [Cupriavidus sp. D39]|uniref:hypothetical protein n=1 Tax=Cupriavidus sp. D39 TaxID=2997877 RepID=UPI00226D6C71|nr:hypothetical protein [Cupriavidus sp. D39]MCY0855004.1 hypothetical protein [Cupriavidus sp. D39]
MLGSVEFGLHCLRLLLGHHHRRARLVALRLRLARLQPRFGPQGGQLTASGLVGGLPDRLHGVGRDLLERLWEG